MFCLCRYIVAILWRKRTTPLSKNCGAICLYQPLLSETVCVLSQMLIGVHLTAEHSLISTGFDVVLCERGSSPSAYSTAKLLTWLTFSGNEFHRLAGHKDVSFLHAAMASGCNSNFHIALSTYSFRSSWGKNAWRDRSCCEASRQAQGRGQGWLRSYYETSSIRDLSGQLTLV